MSDNATIIYYDDDFAYDHFDLEPFSGYAVQAEEPGPAFYAFVGAYTVLAFLLIAPLVSWSRQKEEKKILELEAKHEQQPQHAAPSQQPQEVVPEGTDTQQQTKGPSFHSHHNISSGSRSLSGQSMKSARVMSSRKSQASQRGDEDGPTSSSPVGAAGGSQVATNATSRQQKQTQQNGPSSRRPSSVTSGRSSALRSIILRELDQSYPDLDPDFQARMVGRGRGEPSQPQTQGIPPGRQQQHHHHHHHNSQLGTGSAGSKATTEASSGAPSAATTTQLYAATTTADQRFGRLVLDVGGRRWRNRRPIGRVDVIQSAVTQEIIAATDSSAVAGSALAGGGGGAGGGKSVASGPHQSSLMRGGHQTIYSNHHHSKGMSDVASSILSEQSHQLQQQPQIHVDMTAMERHQMQHAQFQQQQHPMLLHRLAAIQRQRYQRSQRSYSSKAGSRSVASERSIMSSIVDDISPQDAADANDPGQGNIFVDPDVKYLMKYNQQGQYGGGFGVRAGCLTGPIEGLLSLAAPDKEKMRVLKTSIPLAVGASSESLLRLVTAAFISQYLGTDSMVAFLLVGLFVRLTSEELSSAIVDALSAFVQACMHSPVGASDGPNGGNENAFLAGQYVQLGVILQLLLNAPLLCVWALFMDDVMLWFVDSTVTSTIAQEYASVVVFAYMVQALSRTLTVVFHICGHEHFETVIDMVASTLQLVTIACIVAMVDNISLTTVGYIQLLITVACAVAKITFSVLSGWMQPFRKGLLQSLALRQNKRGIWLLLRATGPLLLGSVLEYGEWELLTIFVQHLGSAEVATWALLGAFWDVLEAWTEGIGEAAASQVAFLLAIGQADRARNLSYSVVYMAVTQATLITSALFMSGQYLAVLFSTDPTIQHLINNNIAMLGFANIVMAFAQIAWSLVGAQGRFRLATCVIFFCRWLVTIPCALISIYVFFLDLNAVSGSLVVGYATASCALCFVVARSDWDRLVRLMQELNQPFAPPRSAPEGHDEGNADVDPILGLVDLDDFDKSSDGSDGMGFGGPDDEDGDDVGDHGVDEKSASARSRASRRSRQRAAP